jgi:hypothetical protein
MATSYLRLGVLLAAGLLIGAPPAWTQDDGTGQGDVLGDLVHVKRDPVTGQPILQKKMIESPGDVLGWGYCPVPIDAYGMEIPLLDLSCDVDPAAADRLVEVDYFGRLSAGRTKERNLRMHFDETIESIKAAAAVGIDGAGRIQLGTDCLPDGSCAVWKVIDSPLENLSLYHRIMKYGHIQTDPLEEDTDAHGDPAAGTVYHPALGPDDYAKFRSSVIALLPQTACFTGTTFIDTCADRQSLTTEDFIRAASFLGGASDKHGKMTVDLIHYMNRIIKITVDTPDSLATLDTLPALIRDENGNVAPAPIGLPAPADERLMDFSRALYFRDDRFATPVLALVPAGTGLWREDPAVSLLVFLRFINGAIPAPVANTLGFVKNASDAQRACEFVHNYAVPEDIGLPGAATTTTVRPQTAPFSAASQTIVLEATVSNSLPVNVGTVTFTLLNAAGATIGTPTASSVVTDGTARGNFLLPANTAQQSLVILAAYSGGAGFAASYGIGTLAITATATVTTVTNVGAPLSPVDQTVLLVGTVTADNASPINEGTVTFTVRDTGGTVIGGPVATSVVDNVAQAAYPLPGGLPAQTLTITGAYGGTVNFLSSSGTGVLTVGCPAVIISPATLPHAVLGRPYSQTLTFTGATPVTATFTGTLPPGLTLSAAGVLSGTPAAEGDYSFTVGATDALGCIGSRTYVLYVDLPATFSTGSGPGSVARVRAFELSGTPATGPATDFIAYDPAFQGGVRVAMADVTGDGVPDTITGAGPTGGPHVTVVDGGSGATVRSFYAFPDVPAGGVYVAGGDVDNDGFADIIVGRGSGLAQIRVFHAVTGAVIRDIVAFAPLVSDGVRVGSVDVNGDGYADIIGGAGPGSTPTVQVIDGASGNPLTTFQAYPAGFAGGVFVAGADVTGDGFGDIITGPGAGGGPHVRVWSGTTYAEHVGFFAFDPTFTGGVRVGGSDLNRDGFAEILTSAGPGGGPNVRVFDGGSVAPLADFMAYDASFTGGVYSAANGPMPRMAVDVPAAGAVVTGTFPMVGWAFYEAAVAGTGVDAVHVWAYPVGGAAPMFVGTATLGDDRPDVAAAFGDRWQYSGFHLTASLAPGVYHLVVFAHTDVSGTFNNRRVVQVTVQ